jgi:hypothetical protein
MRKRLYILFVLAYLGTIVVGCSKKEIESVNVIETEIESESTSEVETESETDKETETEVETEVKLSKEQQYVMDLFNLVLDREADETALAYFEKILLDENKGVRQVILMLFQSEEFKNRKLGTEEFVKMLYASVLGRKASKEELEALKELKEEYADYVVLAVKFIHSEEFGKNTEANKIPVGSLPTINNEVIISNTGEVVSTSEAYNKNKDNIKFKYPVENGKQNTVIAIVEETEKEVEIVTVPEQTPQINNHEVNTNVNTNTGSEQNTVPQQTTQAPQPSPSQPQTQPQSQAPVWVVTKAAWTEEVPIYEWQLKMICACGHDITGWTDNQISEHLKAHMLAGDYHLGSWATQMVEVQVGTQIIHHPEEGFWR